MKKIIYIVIAVVVLIGGYLLLNKEDASESQPLKVGALLILSGDFAKYGESAQNAIKMATDKYNSDVTNTRKIQVIYEDTKGDPKTTVSAYKKLVSLDKVDAIIGPLLQVESEAIYPLVEQDRIPVFIVSVNPMDKRGLGPNPMSVWPDPTLESGQMAKYVYDGGVRTVGILSTRDSWEMEVSTAFANEFSKLGGKIVANEVVLQNSTDNDVSLPVTKVISKRPDAIFFGTYYKFIPFVKKVNELGYKGKKYSIEIDTYLAGETNPVSNGLQFISPEFYTDDFAGEYEKLFGQKPTIPSGQAYDAMNILLSIVPGSKDSDEAISKISELKEFSGASGTIKFTDKYQAVFPLSIFEIQEGVIKHVN